VADCNQVAGATGTVNSEDTVYVVLTSFSQRLATIVGDLVGSVYSHGTEEGSPVTLSKVEYSTTSALGPWTEVSVLTDDSAYTFPSTGSPSGEAFQLPVTIVDDCSQIWFRITVSY